MALTNHILKNSDLRKNIEHSSLSQDIEIYKPTPAFPTYLVLKHCKINNKALDTLRRIL